MTFSVPLAPRSIHWLSTGVVAVVATVLTVIALLLAPAAPAHAQEVEIKRASLENSEEGYRIALGFDFQLNRDLEDAISRGLSLYFTTQIEITRPRWYWLNDKTVSTSQTTRISYNTLTRQYHAAIGGRLRASFKTLDEALALVRNPGRWIIAEPGVLKPGETYLLSVRMGLDLGLMAKPFQVNALNSSDWRLSSERAQFKFRAE